MGAFFRIFAVMLCAAWAGPAAAAEQEVDLELLLGIDVSGSVDEVEAELQRAGYIAAFRDPLVIKAIASGMLGRIAVAYYEWAGFGHMKIIAGWSLIHDQASAHAFAASLTREPPQTARRTAISEAIDFAAPFFGRNSFKGLRRVLDISGDGPNNWGDPVNQARDRAVKQGVIINGLPIMNDRPSLFGRMPMPDLDLYYRKCVIGGPGSFIVVARNFRDFASAVRRKMILEIAGLTPADLPAGAAQTMRPTLVADAAGGDITPLCDAGERRSLQFFLDSSDEWPLPR